MPAEEEDEFLGYNLSTLEIPDYLIGKNTVANDISSVPVINDDDATIKSSSQPSKKDMKDKIHLYGNPRAQMDNGAKCFVTNLLYLLRRVRFFDESFPCRVQMRGATSKTSIIPSAVGFFRVKANNIDGFMDIKCYYSPHFTSTLLSDEDVLHATGHAEEYQGTKF